MSSEPDAPSLSGGEAVPRADKDGVLQESELPVSSVGAVNDPTRMVGNRPLQVCLAVSALVLIWIGVDLAALGLVEFGGWTTLAPWAEHVHLWTSQLLPVLATAAWLVWLQLGQAGGPSDRSFRWAAGWWLVVGGAVADLCLTVWMNPDLSWEANPFVRSLLDAGWTLPWVYGHLLATQALFVALFCTVWQGWWRHRRVLVDSIVQASPQSHWEFLKAVSGGGHLTFRQWLLPLHAGEVPRMYHCIWPTAVAIVLGISLFRWYAALEWCGVIEPLWPARMVAILTGVFGALVLYYWQVWDWYRRAILDAAVESGPSTAASSATVSAVA
jgi:hypothetical protein